MYYIVVSMKVSKASKASDCGGPLKNGRTTDLHFTLEAVAANLYILHPRGVRGGPSVNRIDFLAMKTAGVEAYETHMKLIDHCEMYVSFNANTQHTHLSHPFRNIKVS